MDHQHESQSPSAKIATSAVQVLHEYTGRGPTKAKTTINESVVTILLADTLTTGERTLVDHGHADRVLQVRYDYQTVMRDELVGIVERELDREVIAFMSQNHIDPDLAVEVFVLKPAEASRQAMQPQLVTPPTGDHPTQTGAKHRVPANANVAPHAQQTPTRSHQPHAAQSASTRCGTSRRCGSTIREQQPSSGFPAIRAQSGALLDELEMFVVPSKRDRTTSPPGLPVVLGFEFLTAALRLRPCPWFTPAKSELGDRNCGRVVGRPVSLSSSRFPRDVFVRGAERRSAMATAIGQPCAAATRTSALAAREDIPVARALIVA